LIDIVTSIIEIVGGSTLVFGTIAIWIAMGYYSIRLMRSFRGGILSNGWKYICIAVPFLVFGQLTTGLGGSGANSILMVFGASLSAIGGLMIVIGFRAQYGAWNPKGMKSTSTQIDQKPVPQQVVAKTA
jgi:hypothetical protein